jgi:uncharacterized delta-60 repeat protein
MMSPRTLAAVVCVLLACTVTAGAVTEAWVARYNGAADGDDFAAGVAVDDVGNVYVTGMSYGGSTNEDFLTVKYTPDGEEVWVARHDHDYDDTGGRAIALDGAGNVYIGGAVTWPDGNDYYVIKYDADGVEQWTYRYNCVPDGWEELRGFAVDADGNVYMTGTSQGESGPGHYDYATVKLDTDGNEEWVARFNGPADQSEVAQSLAVDVAGNVYVTGFSRQTVGGSFDYATVKYDPEGSEEWVAWHEGLEYDHDLDVAALAVDDDGCVYLAGGCGPAYTQADFLTVKYDPDGNELWTASYDGPANDMDLALAIDLDIDGNVYVCGVTTVTAGSEFEYVTVKYDPDGNEEWTVTHEGPSSECGMDAWRLCRLVVERSTAYITVQTDCDYATIAYDSDGIEEWAEVYDGPAAGPDWPLEIAAGPDGNVYVTGLSLGEGTAFDFATVKYSPDENHVEGSFHVELTPAGAVILRWVIPSVAQSSGVNVYRSTSPEGRFARVNATPLPPVSPGEYEDVSVWPGTTFWYELRAVRADGTEDVIDGALARVTTPGTLALRLSPPQPNPSHGTARLDLEVPSSVSPARVAIYSAGGELVKVVVDGLTQPGRYSVTWDGTNRHGGSVSSGVYFVRLETAGESTARRIVLVR